MSPAYSTLRAQTPPKRNTPHEAGWHRGCVVVLPEYMNRSPGTFRRPSFWPSLLVACALLLQACQAPMAPQEREPAGGDANNQVVDTLHWLAQQTDMLTSGLSDWQLYSAGNLLLYGGVATAAAAVYGWRTSLLTPLLRGRLASRLLKLNRELKKRLEVAKAATYDDVLRQVRAVVREAPVGMAMRNEILAAANQSALDALMDRPDVQKHIESTAAGKAWLAEYQTKRDLLRDAETVELFAFGAKYEDAAKELMDFYHKKTPHNMPLAREFRAIETPRQLEDWLENPSVRAYLANPRKDIVAWKKKLDEAVAKEDLAFVAMQQHYRGIAQEVQDHLKAVDRKGTCVLFMTRLIQAEVQYELARYPFERFGNYYVKNDSFFSSFTSGRRVHEALLPLDKLVRATEKDIRTETKVNKCARLNAMLVPATAGLLAGVGALLRGASNRRLRDATGQTGDQLVTTNKERDKEVQDAKTKDATEPPAVAKRLAEAREKADETDLRDFYAAMRQELTKKDGLPKIASAIRNSGVVSKQALATFKFDEKLQAFLSDPAVADGILDAALAEAASGRASDVSSIKQLLFSDDKSKAAFRDKTLALLYPSVVKALWAGLVVDTSLYPIDDEMFSKMLKNTMPQFDAIGARYRARPRPATPAASPGGPLSSIP